MPYGTYYPQSINILTVLFNNRILGNVTGAIVNVDEYKVHETHDGRVDKTRSDMYLHFVDHHDNSIMEVSHVLRIIDENIEHLDSLFKVSLFSMVVSGLMRF